MTIHTRAALLAVSVGCLVAALCLTILASVCGGVPPVGPLFAFVGLPSTLAACIAALMEYEA